MPKLKGRVPHYRLHKISGQAIVTLCGRDHYLGLYGSAESKLEYDRLIAEWLAYGRRTPTPAEVQPQVTVNHIILAFWQHAQNYYRKPDGTPTSEQEVYRQLLRHLRRLYGHTPAIEFGPRALESVRQQMIEMGWSRKSINKQVHRLCAVFKYAASKEMIPASIYQQLKTLSPLKRGRSAARETPRVRPVPQAQIDAVLPLLNRQVRALMRLQLLTCARGGELLTLRGIDLKNTNEKIWTLEPEAHKTAHHDCTKIIYFGPQAQAILQEFLVDRPLDAYLFSPREAEAERRDTLHAARKTPLGRGNHPGSHRVAQPRRPAGDHYDPASYRRAIERACNEAFPPPEPLQRKKVQSEQRKKSRRWETLAEWSQRLGPERWQELRAWKQAHRWHPHQLRHNAATYIRKEFGVEMSRIILGNHSIAMAEIYAELDETKAKEVMRKIG